MSEQESSKYPYWVSKTDQCMWCNQFSELSYIGVSDTEDSVIMEYECGNPKCYSVNVLGNPAKQIMRMTGKNAVESFRRRLEQKQQYRSVSDFGIP